MSRIVTRPLRHLSLCPCGYGFLQDAIQRGTNYRLDLGRMNTMNYHCGGCGRDFPVVTVHASQVYAPNAPMAPLPWGLFTDCD